MNIYIIIFILVIIISIVVYLIISNNKSTPTSTPITPYTQLDSALTQSGINKYGTTSENFEDVTTTSNVIIFDDIQKIMENFELFASIYFPKLNLTRINDKLKTDNYKDNAAIYNKTVQQILKDAAPNQVSRNRFKLKPVIDIYSRILLDDTNDINIDRNFELAMIGLIIFLNAKSANRQFTSNGKSGNVVYEYNPDYETINELRIFMSTPYNKGKDLLNTGSLTTENTDCLVNKLCYTTSADLKSFYLTSNKSNKEEKEKENKVERENKKKEVKNQIIDLNELLDFLFIANLIFIQDDTKENVNAIVNELLNKTFSDKKIRYRGFFRSMLNSKNVELDTEDKPTTTQA